MKTTPTNANAINTIFEDSCTLYRDAPCNTSTAVPNSECPKDNHTRGICEWPVSLALSSVCVNVSGNNSLGRLSQLRPVRLQEHRTPAHSTCTFSFHIPSHEPSFIAEHTSVHSTFTLHCSASRRPAAHPERVGCLELVA